MTHNLNEKHPHYDLLFYDVEVFKHDWIAVFKDIDNNLVASYVNTAEHMDELIHGVKLVGYNNHHYDDRILPKMRDGWTAEQIKSLNDQIIGGDKAVGQVGRLTNTLDCFQEIDPSRPSLKLIEANMGKAIIESSVDFNIDRRLTEDEIQEAIKYCSYDVGATIAVYKQRENDYFKAKQILIDMHPRGEAVARWNTTTISASLLLDRPRPKWSSLRLGAVNDHGDYIALDEVPDEVTGMWLASETDQKKISFTEFHNAITFGDGGLHGAHVDLKHFEKVQQWDVTSMYPHIVILLNVLGDQATAKYRDLLAQRIQAKREGNKTLATALKLVLNSVYGNLRNEYSLLYNPNAARSVCYYGQAALYTLAKWLAPLVTIVNLNTDGISVVPNDGVTDDMIRAVIERWEAKFQLALERGDYDHFYQANINGYLATRATSTCRQADQARYDKPEVNNLPKCDKQLRQADKVNEDAGTGNNLPKCDKHLSTSLDDKQNKSIAPRPQATKLKIKAVGADVSKHARNSYYRNNSLRIVDLAIVNKVVYDIDPIRTIQDNLNKPELFQIILKAGRTFAGVFDEHDQQYQHINRVFAVTDGIQLFKKRVDGGRVKFPNAPINMYVYNDDLSKLDNLGDMLDLTYYYDLIKTSLERWLLD